MLSRQDLSRTFAHISLLLIGLMWVLPFLEYYHAYPLTTFYQEWTAATLGLAALSVLLAPAYWRQPQIPRIVLLPIGMVLLLAIQYFSGKIAYFGQALLYALYMLWAALLMMLGQYLRKQLGLAALVTALAVALVLGAELNALAAVLQHYRWHTVLDPVVTVKNAHAVYGNIAQPNHFADYLTLGLASLGLLYVRAHLKSWQVILLALPLLFVLPLSGSRSTWLYLMAMAAIAYGWQRRDEALRPLLRYCLLLLLGFGLMHLVVELPWFAGYSGSITALQRLFGEVGGGSIRAYLLHEAGLIFMQYPVLGAGWGAFAWQHFLLGPQLHDGVITGLYNNAHDLVMQSAAETGLAGLLVLGATMLPWLRRARQAERSAYHWWGYAVLATLGIHSLLEYPLWYAYFLGIAALLLGMFDLAGYRLELRGLGRLSVAMVLLLGAVSLLQLFGGYRQLESLLAQRPAAADDRAYVEHVRDGLLDVGRQALLQPYAELFMDNMIEVAPEQIAVKLAYNERVMHFVPISPVVYRQALLLAQAGDTAAACRQMERAIWSYPGDFAAESKALRELAHKDPGHFGALLEFAVRKNEEYQSAIHTK